MSDLQDLIHKTSMDCIRRGAIAEQQRIIKLLEPLNFHTAEKLAISVKEEYGIDYKYSDLAITPLIKLIKGETNEY